MNDFCIGCLDVSYSSCDKEEPMPMWELHISQLSASSEPGKHSACRLVLPKPCWCIMLGNVKFRQAKCFSGSNDAPSWEICDFLMDMGSCYRIWNGMWGWGYLSNDVISTISLRQCMPFNSVSFKDFQQNSVNLTEIKSKLVLYDMREKIT